jgi:hypothetical protein
VYELKTPGKDQRTQGAVYCELMDLEASSHGGWLAREMVVEGRGDERTRACRLGGCPARHRGHVAAFPRDVRRGTVYNMDNLLCGFPELSLTWNTVLRQAWKTSIGSYQPRFSQHRTRTSRVIFTVDGRRRPHKHGRRECAARRLDSDPRRGAKPDAHAMRPLRSAALAAVACKRVSVTK